WLYSLQRFGIKLGLENIRRLERALAIDLSNARIIHVAGTNGKGSVCAMIDSICRAGQYRTGLFISPHLVTFRERIRVNGEMISENEVAEGLTEIRGLVRDWDPHPTFFEVTTALALKHFANSKIENGAGGSRATWTGKPERVGEPGGEPIILVLETGLGGRLDATNAVQSNVAVITPIALDHEKWLGDSLEKIAGEKAGIIKDRRPVISARQPPEADRVISLRAAESEALLQVVDQPYEKSSIALRGEFQKLNAALAIAAIRAARINVDDAAIARGLATVEWPARFQCWDKRTVIDGAHNPAAAKTLVTTWREVFADERATLILAVLSDKDLSAICETLTPIADSILLPKIRTERAVDPQKLAEICDAVCRSGASPAGQRGDCPPISVVASFDEAFATAREKSAPILITGSLHFAGEALAHLQDRPAAFEECNQ
ncbi:MAG TPA: folylpolyglutamate synthase/dihydrofolate synthase family protein, partial [Chthoniobacterales bacterium]